MAEEPSQPGEEPKLDLTSLTRTERRNYLLALVSIASTDEELAPREKEILETASERLGFRLRPSDYRTYDLERLVRDIERPRLRQAVMEDLRRLAAVDREFSGKELEVLEFFAREWQLPLPEIPGVDWEQRGSAPPVDPQKLSGRIRRRGRLGDSLQEPS